MLTPTLALRRLRKAYGPLEFPQRRDPLDELILTILSQNTSDVNRDRAWASLRARFPAWEDVAAAPVGDVEDAIRVGGLAATKAPRIQAVLHAIERERGAIDLGFLRAAGDEEAEAFLAGLPGVGPKTVACVLAFSLGRDELPVDTHVHRVARRVGWIGPREDAVRAHRTLREIVRPSDRLPLHVALITHGRRTCTAQRPACERCVLADRCPRVGVAS